MDIKILLIIDLTFPKHIGEKIFEKESAILPGLGMFPILSKMAEQYGIKCLTRFQFIDGNYSQCSASRYGISYEGKKDTVIFFDKYKIKKFIVYTGESPRTALEFFRNIKERVQGFKHVFVFSGAKKHLIGSSVIFHDFKWPNSDKPLLGVPWKERRLITFVSSAKSRMPANFENIISRVVRFPRYYSRKFRALFDTIDLGIDITQYRRDAIKYFALYNDFQLFGKGWESAIRFDSEFSKINFKNFPKTLPLGFKQEEMGKSKFVFCFENTIYPGYITEKIFDAMLGGAVPVWRGCEEIYDYIPANCFIDAKKFVSFQDMYMELQKITEEMWLYYRNNIQNYLSSIEYQQFTAENFSSKIISLLLQDTTVRL